MADKSEMILKSVSKIIFVEMTMPVVFKLTQTGNLERYILITEDKLKTNYKLDSVKCLLKENICLLTAAFDLACYRRYLPAIIQVRFLAYFLFMRK